jgi:hypothetical protein
MKKRSNDSCSLSSPEESPLSNHSDESTVEHDSKAAATNKSEDSKNNNENQSPSPLRERFIQSPSPATDTTIDSPSASESSESESETSEMIKTAQQLDFDCEAFDFSFRPRKFSKKWRCKTIKATGPMKLSRRLS